MKPKIDFELKINVELKIVFLNYAGSCAIPVAEVLTDA